jgi:hypothetical protein
VSGTRSTTERALYRARTCGVPPPTHAPLTQVAPPEQVPQSSRFPQPSASYPQLRFKPVHVSGTHDDVPHAPATPPPPHVSPAGHVHVIEPPQPSPLVPQPTPGVVHVIGVQPPQTPATPPPPHV